MEYTVVETPDMILLCATVNHLISEGWRPQGGIAATYSYIDHPGKFSMPGNRETISNYCQAMTKE